MDCAKGTRLAPKPMNSKVIGSSAAETAGTAQEQGDQDVNGRDTKDMPKAGAMGSARGTEAAPMPMTQGVIDMSTADHAIDCAWVTKKLMVFLFI